MAQAEEEVVGMSYREDALRRMDETKAAFEQKRVDRDLEGWKVLQREVRNAIQRARETGEDQTVESITIYGVRLTVRRSEVYPRSPN